MTDARSELTHEKTVSPLVSSGVNKVPQISAAFWITKLLTTGGGEAVSDFFLLGYNQIIVLVAAIAVFVVVLIFQFRSERYISWLYWSAVMMVAIVGTMVSDVTDVLFGVPYFDITCVLAVVLVALFTAWYRTQGTLSIHAINSRPREWFYWGTVFATFAFGTALGDWTAEFLPGIFLGSAIVFTILICIPGLAYRYAGLNSIAAFWTTYILTRPLGASIADWISVPGNRGGLDVGKGPVALIATAGVVAMVIYARRRKTSAGLSIAE